MNRRLRILASLAIVLLSAPTLADDTIFFTTTGVSSGYCGGGAANVYTDHFGIVFSMDEDHSGEPADMVGQQHRCVFLFPDPVLDFRIEDFVAGPTAVGASWAFTLTTVQSCVRSVREYRGSSILRLRRSSAVLGLPIASHTSTSPCLIPGECSAAPY